MDRTARAAVRLPPVARLACPVACVLLAVLTGFPTPAAARALPPPPQRVAAVWGRAGWPAVGPGNPAAPPLERWAAHWAESGPLPLPAALRSPYG